MVTGWSYLVASNGVPASWNSCTSACPREVTRSEACIGLPPDICGISGTVTAPSHSPARLFMVVKDFCASDCAKARVERHIRTTDSRKRWDVMFILLKESHFFFDIGPGLFAGGLSCEAISSMNPCYVLL